MPEYIQLDLPSDTITLTANSVVFLLTAAGDGKHVTPVMVIDSRELGHYAVMLDKKTMQSITEQVRYFEDMPVEQVKAIATGLHGLEDQPDPGGPA
ncbi:hypothetical protein [Mycobacteroides abscessus]|uniref:hypothetical protein n=1 Tax=Mycobacteroides abscessus TaxID=36809 RepID=UPI000927B1F4|nr:hypothetical protein [Mycobacteroides abscessus]MBN7544908.1 hypothetical protein [Mycobacteroides abscessus subsp. abscessus]QSM96391.1 hypothetical protein I3U31_12145 [Mycobacteroides abscessus subsp. abscessus]QSN01423.1 hypothetical protein I3U40_12155 [Mycobacteroides abscessus subsp. abscessus]SHU73308.1 Uncharacterised protein [Mycobacteroides abscessus subsp. abscessus]SHV33160.1 Uncharacterised protein [Mycobacteroides abscessus subsp. abscessus]